ncbi:MAG: DUF896 domain-containing protein [Ruminococcaceae bacterium]|nr:DUF896 domain-containing protein [Oscillospiraceae bacterium]MBQ9969158.1 DUF896 domain-containing protein [Oscillospiraceae bacterium]
MENSKLDRINELARKSRTPEGLTDAEKEEQAILRKEYIALFRGNMEAQLQNLVIVNPDGSKRQVTKKN